MNEEMNDKLEQQLTKLEEKFINYEKELINPDNLQNYSKIAEISKQMASIENIIKAFREYKKNIETINECKVIIVESDDGELTQLAKSELSDAEHNNKLQIEKIKQLLTPDDPNNNRNVIIEIRAAAGGDEAALFAADLYQMYYRYAESKRWTISVIDEHLTDSGGFSFISFSVKGKKVYGKLRFEAGTHRVQRVPTTESQGRIHTSTATVAVLPEVKDVELSIKPADLKIDTYRSGGAGGQHVNKTDSAVRITHIPTGTVVSSQEGRSQHENKEQAMRVLRAKIYENILAAQKAKLTKQRRDAIGTGERAEKIRTYNYPQNRVTDHRVNLTLNQLDQIINGKLDGIIDVLQTNDKQQQSDMNFTE